ncbi:MAG: hypothetical protein M3P33_03210 [bacterium]|nr:hypothetical protein [bacterium]
MKIHHIILLFCSFIVIFFFFFIFSDKFEKPLTCEQLATGYLNKVTKEYKNNQNFAEIWQQAIDTETKMYNLCVESMELFSSSK